MGVALRSTFLGCFFAPTGNLFFPPQSVHSRTRTSAQGFLPPLLMFSTVWLAVRPGTRIVLQRLHMVRLSSTDSRSWALRETCCKSDPSWRARGECFGESWLCVWATCSSGPTSFVVPFEVVCKVRYMAAWYRKVVRACKCLLGIPLDFGGLTLLMVLGWLETIGRPQCLFVKMQLGFSMFQSVCA